MDVPLVLLNHDRRRLDVARARRDLRRLLHVVRHQFVVLVVVHLRVERPKVILSHSCCMLVAASLELVVGYVVRPQCLVRVRVPRLRVLAVEVPGHAARLPRVLSLAVGLLFFVAVAEHCVIANSIHLRLVLLPEVEGVRLQMVSHPWTHILLPFAYFYPADVLLVLLCKLLLHLQVVTVISARLTCVLQVLLLHHRLQAANFARCILLLNLP